MRSLRRFSVPLAVVVGAVVWLGPADAEPTISTATCGSIEARYLYSIKTQRVSCIRPRQVARQWAEQCAQLRTGSCLVTALYYCRYRDTGTESGSIKCIHDSDLRKPVGLQRIVAFATGS